LTGIFLCVLCIAHSQKFVFAARVLEPQMDADGRRSDEFLALSAVIGVHPRFLFLVAAEGRAKSSAVNNPGGQY
jgi:hypothetical protein